MQILNIASDKCLHISLRCKNLKFELTFDEEGPGAAVAGLAAVSRDISGLESSRRTCGWTPNCIRCSFVPPLLLRRRTEDLLVAFFPRLLAGDEEGVVRNGRR